MSNARTIADYANDDGISGNKIDGGTISGSALANDVTMSANQACVKTALNASGSAPIYACRAWATFKNSSVYASGNCSSVTDLGTGEWQMNFSTAMPTVDYSVSAFAGNDNTNQTMWMSADQNNSYSTWKNTSYIKVAAQYSNNARDTNTDSCVVHLAMFC